MKPKYTLRPLLNITPAIVTLLAAAPALQAATLYWDGTDNALWATAGNWSTAPGATTPDPAAAPGAADDAVFNITTVNANLTVQLSAAAAANSLTFNNTGTTTLRSSSTTSRALTIGGGGITMASGAGAVTFGISPTNNNTTITLTARTQQTWTNNSTADFTINNSAVASITRNAGATLIFNPTSTGSFKMSTAHLPNVNDIVGPWAFFGTGTNTRYASNNSGTIAAFTGTSATNADDFVSATTNYEFNTTGTTTLTGNRDANTIRYSGSGNVIDLGASGANTLSTSGILAVGSSGTLVIQRTGGTGTLNAGTELVIAGPQNVTIAAPITGTALTYAGPGTLALSDASTYTGETVISGGNVNLTGSIDVGGSSTTGRLSVVGNGSLLVDGGSATFRGSATGDNNAMVLGNDTTSGTITVQNSGSLSLSNGRFILGAGTAASPSNSGPISTFTQTSGTTTIASTGASFIGNVMPATMTISGGTFSAGALNIGVRANSTLTISGANTVVTLTSLSFGGGGATNPAEGTSVVANLNGGTLAVSSVTAPAVGNRTHSFNFDGGTLKATGASASFFSTGTNLTASVKASGGTIDNNGFAITIGQDLLTDPVSTGGGMTFKGGGTTTLTGTSTYTGATTVQQGTLALGASGTISSTLVLGTVGGGTGTLDVTAKSSFTQANVSGSGTLNIGAGKTINVSTTLAPGFSPGELEVIGNLTLEDTAITTIELAGILGVAGTDFDFVDVSGALTWDGALNIVSFGGYNIDQAATYNLFDASSFAGDFNSVSVGGTGLSLLNDSWTGTSGLYSYEFDQTNGVLTVIPEPSAALLGGLGLLALLRRRRA